MTCGRLYLYDAVLERLVSDLQPVAAARAELIPAQDAVMGPRHVAWPRPVAAADQSHIRHGGMRGPNGAGGGPRPARPGAAGHTGAARGLEGFRHGHGGPEGGEAPRQPRRAGPWRAQEEDIVGRTPASRSGSQSL